MKPKKKNSVSQMRLDFLKNRNLKRHPGIYAIINKKNGNIYIGQSRCMLDREDGHFKALKYGKHVNPHLQNAYNLYGNVFEFLVIETCEDSQLLEREQYWIERMKPEYNILKNVYANPFLEIKEYYSKDETFERPEWHAWVYGGERNPLLDKR